MQLCREPREFQILAVGDLNVDLIMTGLQSPPKFGGEVLADAMSLHAGGSTANLAMYCARLGLKTALVANVGRDAFGDFLMEELERARVDTAFVARHETLGTGLTVSLSCGDDRAFVTHLATIDSLSASDVDDDLLAHARHLHVGGYYLQSQLAPGILDLFARAHAQGLTTSLDTGYDVAEAWDGGLAAALQQTDVFLPNETEAMGVTGRTEPRAALRELAERCEVVVLKMGERGSVGAREGELWTCQSLAVAAVDTTCCGDAFNAGFLQALLEDCELEVCLARGNVCGALVATTPGNSAELLSASKVREAAASLLAAGAATLVAETPL